METNNGTCPFARPEVDSKVQNMKESIEIAASFVEYADEVNALITALDDHPFLSDMSSSPEDDLGQLVIAAGNALQNLRARLLLVASENLRDASESAGNIPEE